MKFRSTYFGSGKHGNIVGVRGKDGEYYSRTHVRHIKNPNTPAQQEQRMRMRLTAQFVGTMSPFINEMFMASSKLTSFSQAIKNNIRTAVTGTFPNLEVDYTLALVSNGNVDLPYSPSATTDGTSLSLTWSDNTGMGNALSDDKICVVAFNPTKGQSVYSLNLAERNERSATFTLPTAWTGDTVNVWMAMKREKNGETSKSVHLASLTL